MLALAFVVAAVHQPTAPPLRSPGWRSGPPRQPFRSVSRSASARRPTTPRGAVPNAANTWGVIYRDGLIYANDINSGLWIVRIEPRSALIP